MLAVILDIEVLAFLAVDGIDPVGIFFLDTCALPLGCFGIDGAVLRRLVEDGVDHRLQRIVLTHLHTEFLCNTHQFRYRHCF